LAFQEKERALLCGSLASTRKVTPPLAGTVVLDWYVLTMTGGEGGAKLAVTLAACVIATRQLPVPLHPPPDQPLKRVPEEGVAVSVTEVPCANKAVHLFAGQLMPTGAEEMEPVPVPASKTLSELNAVVQVALHMEQLVCPLGQVVSVTVLPSSQASGPFFTPSPQ
jgi:hypothetical protein